ncbi:MAG: hypothetical protein H6Q17_2127 [Bacteroidetes bacterium]|nr:hypothetical protein [Bacteroidota bacterium]
MDQVKFVAEYAAHQMGCGIHTSRVIRNTKRLGDALNFDVNISVFQKSIILTIQKNETQQIFSEVVEIPALPISFEHNSELSGLSWEAVDRRLTFEEIKEKYNKIISAPRMNRWLVILLVGLANASFCRLFGGDALSMLIVCIATFVGFYARILLQERKVNHYIIFIVSSFIASMISSTALLFDTTSEIALATSVLYLIPGVPLINGVIDIIEGHTLTGISRLTNALLLIICIAIGLSFTLFLFTNSLV